MISSRSIGQQWIAFIRCAAAIAILNAYPREHWSLPLIVVVGIIAVYSALTVPPALRDHWIHTQPDLIVAADVLLTSMLVYSTGGLSSPFVSVLYLPVLEAAICLSFRSAVGVAIWSACWLTYFGVIVGLRHTFNVSGYQRVVEFLIDALLIIVVFAGFTRFYHRRIKALEEDRDRLRDLADRDPLTGVLNRRAFHQRFEAEIKKARRRKESLAVILIDVDNMKRINDERGHQAGDDALIRLTEHMARCSRAHDVISRFGGDEFAALLPGVNEDGADVWVKRLQSSDDPDMPEFSVGGAFYPASAQDINGLIRVADKALSP
jgi:diguanylate cyclase (GGDEF)-like protein